MLSDDPAHRSRAHRASAACPQTRQVDRCRDGSVPVRRAAETASERVPLITVASPSPRWQNSTLHPQWLAAPCLRESQAGLGESDHGASHFSNSFRTACCRIIGRTVTKLEYRHPRIFRSFGDAPFRHTTFRSYCGCRAIVLESGARFSYRSSFSLPFVVATGTGEFHLNRCASDLNPPGFGGVRPER